MSKKSPPDILSPEYSAYISTLNERNRRLFLALMALNTKTYDIYRPLKPDYKDRLSHQLIRAVKLPLWNYLIKPYN